MKTIKAVAPYIYPGGINFKHKPYEAWVRLGGQVAPAHYPPRCLHGLAFRYEIPRAVQPSILASLTLSITPIFHRLLHRSNLSHEILGRLSRAFNVHDSARLRFVQPWTIEFDTFPDYALYEVIPFFWDVWPENFEKTFAWLKRHEVKTAIFTSSQVAEMVREKFPDMNVLAVTEGIDVETYSEGKRLKDREIDFLEYGREIDHIVKYSVTDKINYVRGKRNGKPVFSQQELVENLANSKVVAAYTKKWTNPGQAGDIDTLTQRYWECMLSGCVMIGHAPKELVDLIGYNPVIEVDREKPDEQLMNILANITDYQELADKNRTSAIKYGDWKYSMQRVMKFLQEKGYTL